MDKCNGWLNEWDSTVKGINNLFTNLTVRYNYFYLYKMFIVFIKMEKKFF